MIARKRDEPVGLAPSSGSSQADLCTNDEPVNGSADRVEDVGDDVDADKVTGVGGDLASENASSEARDYEFERMLARSGVKIIKYWLSITDAEQQLRFLMRIHDPMKQWKLSPMDLQSRVRWEDYTKAKEDMFDRTSIPEAPWYIVEGNDKRRARLNCLQHLLTKIPYSEVPFEKIDLPDRVHNEGYDRKTLPDSLYVPQAY